VCNLYSITTNQGATIALFRVLNRYVGNLPPMPGVFPDYPAPVVRTTEGERELIMMRWGKHGGVRQQAMTDAQAMKLKRLSRKPISRSSLRRV
jgi:putative SOS response-associated peptidase YedK